VGANGAAPPVSDQVVRVLECLFPETWNGDTIRNPTAFAAGLRRNNRGAAGPRSSP
jgi:hypothetical protein